MDEAARGRLLMVLLDTSVLAYLLYPTGHIPIDPSTGEPVAYCQERLEHFVNVHQRSKILVATPSYAEFLVHAGQRYEEVLELFKRSSALKVVPFDEASSLECAMLELEARDSGDKRSGSGAPWQKVKVDRQIVAIGLFYGVDCLYTEDTNMRTVAQRAGLDVKGIADMPIPETARQHRLDLQDAVVQQSPQLS